MTISGAWPHGASPRARAQRGRAPSIAHVSGSGTAATPTTPLRSYRVPEPEVIEKSASAMPLASSASIWLIRAVLMLSTSPPLAVSSPSFDDGSTDPHNEKVMSVPMPRMIGMVSVMFVDPATVKPLTRSPVVVVPANDIA